MTKPPLNGRGTYIALLYLPLPLMVGQHIDAKQIYLCGSCHYLDQGRMSVRRVARKPGPDNPFGMGILVPKPFRILLPDSSDIKAAHYNLLIARLEPGPI